MGDFPDASRDDFGSADLAGHFVVDHSPGVRWSAVWSGPPPYWKLRLGVALALFALIAGVAVWLILGGAAALMQQVQQAPEETLVWGVFGLAPVLVAYVAGGIFGGWASYWRELTWDGQERQFVARKKGWLIWGNETFSLPLAKISRLAWELGKEGKEPLPIKLSLQASGPSEVEFHTFSFALPEILRRNQALEMILQVGRVIQAKGYVIDIDEFRQASLRLLLEGDPLLSLGEIDPHEAEEFDKLDQEEEERDEDDHDRDEDEDEEDDDEDWDDIPERPTVHAIVGLGQSPPMLLGAGRDPAIAHMRGRAAVPVEVEVDLAKIAERLGDTQLAEWRPGEEVRFVRPAPPKLIYGIATVFGVLAGGAIGYWPLCFVLSIVLAIALGQGKLPQLQVGLAGAVLGGTLAGILAYNRFRHREVTLSWRRRQIAERIGDQDREWPLSDARGIVLTEMIRRDHEGEGSSAVSRTRYGGRLDLVLTDRELLLVETDRWEDGPHEVGQLLAPVAQQLAERLGVPYTCDREGGATEGTDRIGWLDFTLVQRGVLGALLLAGIVALGFAGTGNKRNAQAKARIQAAGGEVVSSSYSGPGNRSFLKDYSGVRFKEGTTDASLAGLRESFAGLPDLGVSLEKCRITQVGLSELGNLSNLKLLILSDSSVTDAGIAVLGHLPELVFLDLSVSAVTDEGLAGVSRQMPGLKFMYLPVMPLVTDAGVDHLQSLSKLEFVILPAQTSPEAQARLQLALPRVQISVPGR